ncbi:hypothetical protein BH09PLA1_BH09PLA1_29320 [soil metagenome]
MKCVHALGTVCVALTLHAFTLRGSAGPSAATTPATLPVHAVQLPDEIRKSLVRNAEQIGPITLACTMQSSSTYTKEQAMEKLKLDDYYASFNSGARHEYRMEWQAGKYRSHFHAGEWRGMPEDHVKEQNLEGAFDGNTIYLGDVRPTPTDPNLVPTGSIMFRIPLTATPSKDRPLEQRGWTHGEYYFTQNALRLPLSIGDLKTSRGPQSQVLFLLESGASLNSVEQVELDGRKVVRLQLAKADPDREEAMKEDVDRMFERLRRESVNTDEELHAMVESTRQQRNLPEQRQYIFYLDPELNYALRRSEERYENNADGILLKRVDCTDFQRLAERDLILPKKCVESEYTSIMMPGEYFPEPTVTRTYAVTELELGVIPQERFTLSFTAPGCEIIDIFDADGARRHVVIQEDGTARER